MVNPTGFKAVQQTTIANTTDGQGFAFKNLTGGSFYNVQVKTGGVMRVNLTGAVGDWLDLGPGLYSDNVMWGEMKNWRVDTGTAFSAVVVMQGAA